jgi:hypothetical protein
MREFKVEELMPSNAAAPSLPATCQFAASKTRRMFRTLQLLDWGITACLNAGIRQGRVEVAVGGGDHARVKTAFSVRAELCQSMNPSFQQSVSTPTTVFSIKAGSGCQYALRIVPGLLDARPSRALRFVDG